LIVDDQREMREMGKLALQLTTSWDVLTASSGPEALRMVAAGQIDAILLDVMMPGMDGPTTLRQLRTEPSTRAIPVVLLTADQSAFDDLEVQGTIAKPFNPLKFATEVAGVLGWTR
jgi:CheY-like chemotaxis protein